MNDALLQEKLAKLKKELAKKKQKLQKCERLQSAKEHVRQKIQEQENSSVSSSAAHEPDHSIDHIDQYVTDRDVSDAKSKRFCVSFKLTPVSIHGAERGVSTSSSNSSIEVVTTKTIASSKKFNRETQESTVVCSESFEAYGDEKCPPVVIIASNEAISCEGDSKLISSQYVSNVNHVGESQFEQLQCLKLRRESRLKIPRESVDQSPLLIASSIKRSCSSSETFEDRDCVIVADKYVSGSSSLISGTSSSKTIESVFVIDNNNAGDCLLNRISLQSGSLPETTTHDGGLGPNMQVLIAENNNVSCCAITSENKLNDLDLVEQDLTSHNMTGIKVNSTGFSESNVADSNQFCSIPFCDSNEKYDGVATDIKSQIGSAFNSETGSRLSVSNTIISASDTTASNFLSTETNSSSGLNKRRGRLSGKSRKRSLPDSFESRPVTRSMRNSHANDVAKESFTPIGSKAYLNDLRCGIGYVRSMCSELIASQASSNFTLPEDVFEHSVASSVALFSRDDNQALSRFLDEGQSEQKQLISSKGEMFCIGESKGQIIKEGNLKSIELSDSRAMRVTSENLLGNELKVVQLSDGELVTTNPMQQNQCSTESLVLFSESKQLGESVGNLESADRDNAGNLLHSKELSDIPQKRDNMGNILQSKKSSDIPQKSLQSCKLKDLDKLNSTIADVRIHLCDGVEQSNDIDVPSAQTATVESLVKENTVTNIESNVLSGTVEARCETVICSINETANRTSVVVKTKSINSLHVTNCVKLDPTNRCSGLDHHTLVEKGWLLILCYDERSVAIYRTSKTVSNYRRWFTWTVERDSRLLQVCFLRRSNVCSLLIITGDKRDGGSKVTSSPGEVDGSGDVIVRLLTCTADRRSNIVVIERLNCRHNLMTCSLSDHHFCVGDHGRPATTSVDEWTIVCYTVDDDSRCITKRVELSENVLGLSCIIPVTGSSCFCAFGRNAIYIWHYKSGDRLQKIDVNIRITHCPEVINEHGLLFMPCFVEAQEFNGCLLVINPLNANICIVNKWRANNATADERIDLVYSFCNDGIASVAISTGTLRVWSFYSSALLTTSSFHTGTNRLKAICSGKDCLFTLTSDGINIVDLKRTSEC